MTALEWTNYYSASSASYVSPTAIPDYYGGEPKYPSWNIFAVEKTLVDRSSNESSPPPALLQKGPASHLKGTIGATVGGVGALLVSIACVIFLSVRSNRKKHRVKTSKRPGVCQSKDERQIPGGLYEAEGSFHSAEAGPGRLSTSGLDTSKPIPEDVRAVALSNTFELEDPERDDGLDCVPTSLELRCHTNGNVSDSIRDPLELVNNLTHQGACSKDDPTGFEDLSK